MPLETLVLDFSFHVPIRDVGVAIHAYADRWHDYARTNVRYVTSPFSWLLTRSRRLQSTTEHAHGAEQASFRDSLQETRKRTHSNSSIWHPRC